MSYAVVIISRGRPEMMERVIPTWIAQNLPVSVLVEPDEAEEYEKAVVRWPVDVLAHPEPNRGFSYARGRAVSLALERGHEAAIMADDDTVITSGDARLVLDFVARGRAVACGGWLGVHGLWFGKELEQQPNRVVPHYCDKVFAINTQLAVEAGNYDHDSILGDAEMNRICIRAGYLWWIHAGVRIKELKPRGYKGGVAAFQEQRGRTFTKQITPEEHQHLYDKWGPRYVSRPPRRFSTNTARLILDFAGTDAWRTFKERIDYEDDDPFIPCRGQGAPIAGNDQLALIDEDHRMVGVQSENDLNGIR